MDMEEVDYENPEEGFEEGQDFEVEQEDVEHESSELEEDSGVEGSKEDALEPEPEEPKTKKERLDIRERLSQVQRERFQALQQAEVLRQENELLRKTAEMSASQALKQYDENLSRRYENAKAAKIRALEEGDVQSQVEADAELSMISAEVYQSNLIKAQSNIQTNQYQQPQAPSYQDNAFYAQEWVKDNPWFNNPSSEHEAWLSKEVDRYCHEFDSNLRQNGQSHLIMSPDYLNVVSQYAHGLMNQVNQTGNRRELDMRQSRTPVSPVRNTTGQLLHKREEIKITPAEKEMAKRLGIDDKTYLQFRLRDERENGDRRNFRRY